MRKKEKVFVIGFQKTGTTSLENALKLLGYKVDGGDKNLMKFETTFELKAYIKSKLENFDAVQDMPWPLFYKELYELYPTAKFILTYREPKSWIKSVVKYFASMKIPLHQKIYEVPCAEGYEDKYLEVYETFNQSVLEYFNNKDNFLYMELGKNYDYKTLCTFLNIEDIPEGNFPKSRSNSQNLSKYKIYRDLRSAYWNFKKYNK